MDGWRLREEMAHWKLNWEERKKYQLIKQADIVLAMFLLEEQFTPEQFAHAYDLYEPITQHVSSLSYNTHALVAAKIGRMEQAYEYYLMSAGLDLENRKNATSDGLHAAAIGGGWQAVVMGFGGMRLLDDKLQYPTPGNR
jgi:trehalose/maltose hydrolase-like predicted phosphorylase